MPVNASRELHLIAVKLKAAGEGRIKLEMTRDLRAAAQPLVNDIADTAREVLPREGGLNEVVAKQATRVSVLTSARSAGVRLKRRGSASSQTNRGYVNHPVYGRPNSWTKQQIPGVAGWWEETLIRKAPAVTVALRRTIARLSREIQGL